MLTKKDKYMYYNSKNNLRFICCMNSWQTHLSIVYCNGSKHLKTKLLRLSLASNLYLDSSWSWIYSHMSCVYVCLLNIFYYKIQKQKVNFPSRKVHWIIHSLKVEPIITSFHAKSLLYTFTDKMNQIQFATLTPCQLAEKFKNFYQKAL